MVKFLVERIRIPYRENKVFGIALLSIFITPLVFYTNLINAYDGLRIVFISILLGSTLIYLSFKKQLSFHLDKVLLYLMGGLVFFGLVSTLFSFDVFASLWGQSLRHADSLIFMLCWVMLIGFYGLVNKTPLLQSLFRVWVVVGVLVAILGILHTFGIGFYAGTTESARPLTPGFEGNQNFSAMLLAGILPMVLPLINQAKGFISKSLYAVSGIVMIWAIVVFTSRGSIIAIIISLLVGLGLLLVRKANWKTIFSVIVALGICALLAVLFYNIGRSHGPNTSLQIQVDGNANDRILVWVNSIDLIKQNPLTGLGFGNFIIGSLSWGDPTFTTTDRFDDAHNLFIHLATSAGLPFIILFIAAIGFAIRTALKDYWRDQSLSSWAVVVGLIGILISASFSPVTIANWLLLGFYLAASQSNIERSQEFGIGKHLRWIMVVGGLLLILFALWFSTWQYLYQVSGLAYRAQQYDKAIKVSRFNTKINPADQESRKVLAAAMIKQKADPSLVRLEIEAAKRFHKRFQVIYADTSTLYFMLYQYTNDPADLAKSYAGLETANLLQPNDLILLNRYAYIAYLGGDKELAEQKLRHSLTTGNQSLNFYGYLLIAQIYLEKENFPATFNALRKANSIQPTPVLEKAIEDYDKGKFDRNKIPVYFPNIDF